MSLLRTTAAASGTVTTTELKTHLRITGSGDDAYLAALEAAATQWAESYCSRAFVTQTWAAKYDEFPDETPGEFKDAFLIRLGDLIAISSFTYVDGNGTTTALSASDYIVGNYGGQIRITPAYGTVWPFAREQADAVVITFTCGYGAASSVPEGIKAAIKLIVGHWYENREAVITGGLTGAVANEVPMAVKSLLDVYRIEGY